MDCPVNVLSPEETLDFLISSLKENIKTWAYFVNWQKVFENIKKNEAEFHLLDFLLGKQNVENALKTLIETYPSVVKTFPILIAIRAKREQILTDVTNFSYLHIDFSKDFYSREEIDEILLFFRESGLKNLFKEKLRSIWDYVVGIEVGLDSNARKNRTGTLMEEICENLIEKASKELGFSYIRQATRDSIFSNWGIKVEIDETDRKTDFAILYNGKLFFIEVNFYSGRGSKLKATAGEYRKLSDFWRSQGIEFIWITDGKGWLSAKNALFEYIKDGNFLLNLEMLRSGCLKEILNFNAGRA